MKSATTKISLSGASLSAALMVSPFASAADNQATRTESPPTPAIMRNGGDYSAGARMRIWSNEKEQLEGELRLGQSKAFYAKTLADGGFHVRQSTLTNPTQQSTRWSRATRPMRCD